MPWRFPSSPPAARAIPSISGRRWPKAGASAALAASIFHYREFTIAETKDYLDRHGVPVRLVASGSGALS